MFNLVLTLITFAFLAIGGYAALHADGGALLMSLERMSDKSALVRLVNEAQQIGAAQRFHLAVNGSRAESPEALLAKGFLKAVPTPPEGTVGAWAFDESATAVRVAFDDGEEIARFAARVCAMAPAFGGAAAVPFSGMAPVKADLDAAGAIFGCAQPRRSSPQGAETLWFIHGF